MHSRTQSKTAGQRIIEIDIIKASAIILMVAGHATTPYIHFIYLFHMAAFIIASGFFFKDRASDDLRSVIKQIHRKLFQLWLPFFVWNAVFVLLHNFFIRINVYTDNPGLFDYVSGGFNRITGPYTFMDMLCEIAKGSLFSTSQQIFGAAWFLKILFMVSAGYLVIDYLVKKLIRSHSLHIHIFHIHTIHMQSVHFQTVISLILLTAGYICSLKGISLMGLAQAASFYSLYHTGHLLFHYKEHFTGLRWEVCLAAFFISYIVLLYLDTAGTIVLDRNSYENPVFLITASIAGWTFLYSLSSFLKQIPFIKDLMSEVGKRTLTVLALHFLAFKIVEALVVKLYNLPDFCLAAFPTLYEGIGLWWVAYTVVGVAVPVIVSICGSLLKHIWSRAADLYHNDVGFK